MRFINIPDIQSATMNDLREYADTSWKLVYSFTDKLILYFKETSIYIVNESNEILMQFQIDLDNIFEILEIRKFEFKNNILILLDKNYATIIDFSSNQATRLGKNGYQRYNGNISQRNQKKGWIAIDNSFSFVENLFDYVNFDNIMMISSESSKIICYDTLNQTHYRDTGNTNSALLKYDKWLNRIWCFDNYSGRLGYIGDRFTGNFSIGNFIQFNVGSFSVGSLEVDRANVYVGYDSGLARFSKNSGDIQYFKNFSGYTTNVNYSSMIRKLNNIVVGTGSQNGVVAMIDVKTLERKQMFGKESIFEGANYVVR